MARRGRNRKVGVARQPNGESRRAREYVIPRAALAQRAAAVGLDVEVLLRHGASAVASILADPGAGTALGRITWRMKPDGTRERRQGYFGALDKHGNHVPEDWITPDMEMAAEEYRALWVRWCRAVKLTRRNPQPMALERRDKGHDQGLTDEEAIKAEERMEKAQTALLRCHQFRMVLTVIDGVLIDNVAPESLVLGERSAALAALRRGLEALSLALQQGRQKRAT